MEELKTAIEKVEKKFGYKIDYDPNVGVYLLWYSNDPTKPSSGRMIEPHEIFKLAANL